MQETPFHIPELARLIGDHLSRTEMVNCLRVSKLLHNAFIARVWKDVDVEQPRGRCPTIASLQRHKHLIQSLHCYGASLDKYLTLRGCNNLSAFSFGGKNRAIRALPVHLSGFISAHSTTLQEISIYPTFPRTPSDEFWLALSQCSNLRTLELYNLNIPHWCSSYLRRICNICQSLLFHDVVIPDSLLTMQQGEDEDIDGTQLLFLGPRHIDLWVASSPNYVTLSPRSQALMIRACPNLESLRWGVATSVSRRNMSTRVRPSTNIFLRTLAANPWTLPKLEALDLTSVHFHDNDFAQLLRQMRKLKSLKVSHTRFGRLSLLEMVKKRARHGTTGDGTGTTYTLCDSVTLLHLDDFPEVTGAMIQTLLASCPKLEVFLGGKVKVSEIAIGDEWVCKGVLHLCLYLEADEDYHAPPVSREFLNNQRNVFARLGRLTNLQGLQLTREWDDLNPTQVMQTLDLRLPAGMKSLANLKELEYLCFFHDCGQRTGLREVRWMVQHWPKLECVAGMTMIDDQTQARMAAVLDPAGVEF